MAKHTMSMYQTKDEMIEAMQVEIDLLEAQLAESRESRNGFANLISDFQELNLGDYLANYTDDDVRRINDWAIEAYAAMKKGE